VERILEREVKHATPPYLAWRRAVEEEGAKVIQAETGQILSLGDGVVIEVVNPPARLPHGTPSDVNNASVVTRMTYGDVSFLLAADLFPANDGENQSATRQDDECGRRQRAFVQFNHEWGPGGKRGFDFV